jgi:hypothetical protein
VCVCVCLFGCLFVCLFVCLFIYLFVCLFVCLLFVCFFVALFFVLIVKMCRPQFQGLVCIVIAIILLVRKHRAGQSYSSVPIHSMPPQQTQKVSLLQHDTLGRSSVSDRLVRNSLRRRFESLHIPAGNHDFDLAPQSSDSGGAGGERAIACADFNAPDILDTLQIRAGEVVYVVERYVDCMFVRVCVCVCVYVCV